MAELSRTAANSERFANFAASAFGLSRLREVSPEVVQAFVSAPTSSGRSASGSTMRWRRTAVRLVFRGARLAGLVESDPTVDVQLGPRSVVATRPLGDAEMGLCRSVAASAWPGARRAAAWALAEATCRTSEIPAVTRDQVDLAAATVLIRGGKSTDPRVGRLSGWGVVQVRRRLDELGDSDEGLVYSGARPGGGGQVAASAALVDVLVRAGLHGEVGVRPGSVAAWAGRRVLEETGRVEDAARALGVRSLDQAARIVGLDWRTVSDSGGS